MIRNDEVDTSEEWPNQRLLNFSNAVLRGPVYKNHCAILDLEGSSNGSKMVLKPYVGMLERLPTLNERITTMSWIVRPVTSKLNASSGDFGTNLTVLQTLGMVRGMWYLLDLPGTRYYLV